MNNKGTWMSILVLVLDLLKFFKFFIIHNTYLPEHSIILKLPEVRIRASNIFPRFIFLHKPMNESNRTCACIAYPDPNKNKNQSRNKIGRLKKTDEFSLDSKNVSTAIITDSTVIKNSPVGLE